MADVVCTKFVSMIGPCGSEFEEAVGDIPGWGTVNGRGGAETVTDCSKCADLCSSDTACKSYECSPSEKKCSLNSVANPTSGAYKDYTFCVKPEGNPFCVVTSTCATIHFADM